MAKGKKPTTVVNSAQKVKRMTKVEKAKRITRLSDWIEDAERELTSISTRRFSITVNAGHRGDLYYIQPHKFPQNQEKRLSQYYRRVVKEQITAAKKERDQLLRTM